MFNVTRIAFQRQTYAWTTRGKPPKPTTTTSSRGLSTSNQLLQSLVGNVTAEAMEKDPELAAYMKANFPEAVIPGYRPPVPPHNSKMQSFGEGNGGSIRPATASFANDDDEDDDVFTETKAPAVYPRNIRPMTTYLRDPETESNSRRSRYLRAFRWIPGLLYGSDPTRNIFSHQPQSKTFVKTQWHLLERDLDRYHREIDARVYELTVLHHHDDDDDNEDDKAQPVMEPQLVVPANVQRHPVQTKLYCTNYVRYHPGRPLKLPVRQINVEESPALKRDGYLIPITRRIECWVDDGVDIPEAIELECTGLQFNEVVRMDRLVLPDGVHLTDRVKKRGDDYVVAVVDGRGRLE
mgnify:CR=1 FL=1